MKRRDARVPPTLRPVPWHVTLGAILGVIIVPLALAVGSAHAQGGEISGRVLAPSGDPLPGAEILLEGPALDRPRIRHSEPSGFYAFPRIPIGTYRLVFSYPTMASVIREGLRIDHGSHARVDAVLDLPQIGDTVEVVASPGPDAINSDVGTTFTHSYLEAIPSTRDLWAMATHTPGITTHRQNIGGARIGRQALFDARGTNTPNGFSNIQWRVDGVSITDMSKSFVGSPLLHGDLESYEQIRVRTGGADASIQTAGVQLDLVTKRGSNVLRGSGRFYLTDHALQDGNTNPELRRQGAGSGIPVQSIEEYGFELGGPLRRDRLWFWMGLGRRDIAVGNLGFLLPGESDPTDPDALATDRTRLDHAQAELRFQPKNGRPIQLGLYRGTRFRGTRGAGPLNTFESTTEESSTIELAKLSWDLPLGNRWLWTFEASHLANSTTNDFQDPSLEDVQPSLDVATGERARSATRQGPFERRVSELEIQGRLHRANLLGGDHVLRWGILERRTPYSDTRHVGGFATARFAGGEAIEADLHRDSRFAIDQRARSLYITDSYRRPRLTVNLGLRFDEQKDASRARSVPANPIVPELLPAVDFAGASSGVTFRDVAPRLGLTYALRPDGRTLLKTFLGRYYGQGIYTAERISPVSSTTLRLPWNDLDGDGFVSRGELDLDRLLNFSLNYDPNHPASPIVPQSIDPGLDNDRTDELVLALEHQFESGLLIALTYTHRRYDHFAWSELTGLSSGDFVPVEFTARCGNDTCPRDEYTVTYYELPFDRPITSRRTTQPDFRLDYRGLELVLRRHLRDRWSFHASLTLNDEDVHFLSDAAFQDPTNIALLNGGTFTFFNVEWHAKLSASYLLAKHWTLACFLDWRQGFPFNPVILTPSRSGSLGRTEALTRPWASQRYEDVHQLDLRLSRDFELPRGKLTLSADVFNATNENTVLRREDRQNVSTANRVREILAPRIARIGLRLRF